MTHSARLLAQVSLVVTAALLLSGCAGGHSTGSPNAIHRANGPVPARVCVTDQGADRATCVVTIGALRMALSDPDVGQKSVCTSPQADELADTYAVMDWIKAHPDRQEDELSAVVIEALQQLHPCG